MRERAGEREAGGQKKRVGGTKNDVFPLNVRRSIARSSFQTEPKTIAGVGASSRSIDGTIVRTNDFRLRTSERVIATIGITPFFRMTMNATVFFLFPTS